MRDEGKLKDTAVMIVAEKSHRLHSQEPVIIR